MDSLLGPTLVGKTGQVPTSSLASVEFVLLYFSAHWCPPCQAFTPKLAAFYQDVNASGKHLEVIFVSFDRDKNSFQSYYNSQPWLAIPFENKPLREGIGGNFRVTGIPKLVLLKRNGTLAHDNCRGEVESLGPRALERWRPLL